VRQTYLGEQHFDLPRRLTLLVSGAGDPDAGVARLEVGVLGQDLGLLVGGLPLARVASLYPDIISERFRDGMGMA
jgi:hypothetical protein